MTDTTEDDYLQLAARVTKEQHTAFFAKAKQHNMTASVLLRELAVGFVEDRVTLAPPKHLTDLYNINKE